jgi:hypothetical protein
VTPDGTVQVWAPAVLPPVSVVVDDVTIMLNWAWLNVVHEDEPAAECDVSEQAVHEVVPPVEYVFCAHSSGQAVVAPPEDGS